MDRNILNGQWFEVASEDSFNNLQRGSSIAARDSTYSVLCRRGDYSGPGRYLLLSYTEPCPRGCCEDSVYEVISAEDIIEECKNLIKEYVDVIKTSRLV